MSVVTSRRIAPVVNRTSYVIETEGLTKRFGDQTAVEDDADPDAPRLDRANVGVDATSWARAAGAASAGARARRRDRRRAALSRPPHRPTEPVGDRRGSRAGRAAANRRRARPRQSRRARR